MKKNLIQFIKFGIVGLSNTLIGYIIYLATLKLLRIVGCFPNTDIYISQFTMFMLSVLWSFYWNNKAVFKIEEGENRNIFKALLKTYATYAFTSLFLSEILLHFWVKGIGISEYVAPIFNLVITVPLNFVIQKFWAFGKQGK
jgi:putative flippase GtrA